MLDAAHLRAELRSSVAGWLGRASGALPVAILVTIVGVLASAALALSSLADERFDPALGRFGLWPLAAGTAATTLVAIGLAAPVALVAAVWVSELAPVAWRRPLASLFEGLGAIPAVVYGVWGRFSVVPFVRDHVEPALTSTPRGHGFGIASAACVLAAMSLPLIASHAAAVLRGVPEPLRMTAFSLGATRWRVVSDVVLPAARSRLFGAVALGVGRAVGESIAVAMVIGGRTATPTGFFDATSTLAAVLVDGYVDATHPEHVGALAVVALVLAAIGGGASAVARRFLSNAPRPA